METRKGIYETAFGLNFTLLKRGEQYDRDVCHEVCQVGVICRPKGFAVADFQGAAELGRLRVPFREDQGKKHHLLSYMERMFGEKPDVWLARQVLSNLREIDPQRPIYWIKGERIHWLYGYIKHPNGGSLEKFVKNHSWRQTQRLLEQRKSQLRSLLEKSPEEEELRTEMKEIEKIFRVKKKYQEGAEKLGFRVINYRSPWYVSEC